MQSNEKSSRDLRQEQCVKTWLKSKGKGCIVASTGFGKSRVGCMIISKILSKYPDKNVLIVVPTTLLKEQWEHLIDSYGYSLSCSIQVINTVIKNVYTCDLLIIDEIQRVSADTFKEVFNTVNYKYVLGLTATFERLDGKHKLIEQYCPICDNIPITECLINGWVSPYKIYQVLIDVDDIETYKRYNKEFTEHFEFFGYDFNLALSLLGPKGFINRAKLRDERCPHGTEEQRKAMFTSITYHATAFMRCIQARKAFINNHPKKIELARKIIDNRVGSKIVTFSNNVKMAEAIKRGNVYTGKTSKKKGRTTIEQFNTQQEGVLCTCFKADEGMDIKGLSVGIVLGTNSSEIKATQRIGRICRFEEGKQAEMFYLIINNSVECEWFKKANIKQNYITINEEGLDAVLRGEEPPPYTKPIQNFTFRF